ncbi:MAG: methyltransferase domain-containing protein [Deltaproteobacteria bacterium]|nr:methyltransferase domain-containing protein [Deltaproteobacteria bacterium]
MPHKFFLVAKPGAHYHLGEYWRDEEMEAHVALCEHETTLALYLDLLPRDAPILDAGCGAGRWVIYLRRRGYDVSGMDRSPEGLARARAFDPGARLVAGDVAAKPFPSASFGAVLSSGVVEHFEEGPAQALAEAARVLRPGGLLLVAVPYNSPLRRFFYHPLMALIRRMTTAGGVQWEFAEYRFTAAEMRRILERAGFAWEGAHPDDYNPPKAKGIWVDYNQLLGRPGRMWELNAAGRVLQRVLNALSPWLSCAGVLCVARKADPSSPHPVRD